MTERRPGDDAVFEDAEIVEAPAPAEDASVPRDPIPPENPEPELPTADE